jgi:hypothetical protein
MGSPQLSAGKLFLRHLGISSRADLSQTAVDVGDHLVQIVVADLAATEQTLCQFLFCLEAAEAVVSIVVVPDEIPHR